MSEAAYQTGTVSVGTPVEIGIGANDKGFFDNTKQVEITAEGANSLQIETRKKGKLPGTAPGYVVQTTISGESVIIDMKNLDAIKLTASGGNVNYQVDAYNAAYKP